MEALIILGAVIVFCGVLLVAFTEAAATGELLFLAGIALILAGA